jgi:hypothetical protein
LAASVKQATHLVLVSSTEVPPLTAGTLLTFV